MSITHIALLLTLIYREKKVVDASRRSVKLNQLGNTRSMGVTVSWGPRVRFTWTSEALAHQARMIARRASLAALRSTITNMLVPFTEPAANPT